MPGVDHEARDDALTRFHPATRPSRSGRRRCRRRGRGPSPWPSPRREAARRYAFVDVNPVAPVHVLVIPRQEIVRLNNAEPSHEAMLGRLLLAARKVAEAKGIASDGYRCVINTGGDGGQSVFHLHLHVIGGRQMAWPPG